MENLALVVASAAEAREREGPLWRRAGDWLFAGRALEVCHGSVWALGSRLMRSCEVGFELGTWAGWSGKTTEGGWLPRCCVGEGVIRRERERDGFRRKSLSCGAGLRRSRCPGRSVPGAGATEGRRLCRRPRECGSEGTVEEFCESVFGGAWSFVAEPEEVVGAAECSFVEVRDRLDHGGGELSGPAFSGVGAGGCSALGECQEVVERWRAFHGAPFRREEVSAAAGCETTDVMTGWSVKGWSCRVTRPKSATGWSGFRMKGCTRPFTRRAAAASSSRMRPL